MKRLIGILIVPLAVILSGCHDLISHPDTIPPSAPTGLYTVTGDNIIELYWDTNRESDVAGYNVFVSSSYDGRYELIGSARGPYFSDTEARNGNLYYYAVTAYDYDGNESELSRDVAYDIPRPEGYGVTLTDYRRFPETGGYDFSDYTVTRYDDRYADIWFENYRDTLYIDVATDSDIQDMGATNSILDIREAPSSGWSRTHDVIAKAGHTYVVWTWDDHYAKFRVTSLSPGRVVFDWAYQIVKSSKLLKPARNVGGERAKPLGARVR